MTTDIAQNGDAPEAGQVAPPRVRMDKSRSFTTIHGTREPGDPLYGVMYRQDGIPCDGEGFFLFDHPDMKKKGPEGDRARKMAEKHIKRAEKAAAVAPPPKPKKVALDDDDDDEEIDGLPKSAAGDDDDDDDLLPPVNLAEWLRGAQDATWLDVSQEIARTYKRRIAKVEDAVAFLVDGEPRLVAKAELRPKFKKFAA